MVVAVVVVAATAAVGCDERRVAVADGGQSCTTNAVFKTYPSRKLDVLFVVDDSPGMANMQDKLARGFPLFMPAFVDASGGYPELHVAVISSSLGGGRFANVPGCEAGSAGARDGAFSHPAGAGLAPGETFMRLNGGPLNFSGSPGTVFAALANLGVAGCPYPQPLAAARRALSRAQDPSDPDNAGFLRADAELAVIIVTNQDDCSVPADSDLFDPGQSRVADPYGAQGTYRCAEFGLRCDGVKPPHALSSDAEALALHACVPAEAAGRLTPIEELVADLRSLKSEPDMIDVSLIGGPPAPVVVGPQMVDLGGGVTELQPRLQASCTGAGGEAATPSVRLKAWADAFTANGLSLPACVEADVLSHVLVDAARWSLEHPNECVAGAPLLTVSGTPDCLVTQTSIDEHGTEIRWALPACDADRTVVPCWKVAAGPQPQCLWLTREAQLFTVCRDPTCSRNGSLTPKGSVEVRCQIACP